METDNKIILVDSDSRRRATISHQLSTCDIHVEPFENHTELTLHWPKGGTILANDSDGSIAALFEFMGETGNWMPIVGYAENPQPHMIVNAILAGAVDYLAWPLAADTLRQTITVAQERTHGREHSRMRQSVARNRINRLTQREREVLTGVANGLSNRMIGEELKISPRTVEIHRSNMLNKMGVSHTSEAIRVAVESSLIY